MNYTITRTNCKPLPSWASDILASPPSRGEGLNRWLMRASIALRRCNRTDDDIENTLSVLTATEPMQRGEIKRAVERSADYMTAAGTVAPRRKACPDVDPAKRAEVIEANPGGEAELWDESPRRLIDGTLDADLVIDLLFNADDLLCCAADLREARTAPRSEWRDRLGKLQFIVPSPMTATRGLNQDGKSSTRCLNNTGERRYLVIEQDMGTADEQAGVIIHLSKFAPLVMVVHSGGKSLHAWFSCKGANDRQVRGFFHMACELGADPATWTRCQMVRMPEGVRANGAPQRVTYFNQEVI